MNRITAAIAKTQITIDSKGLTPEKQRKLSQELNMGLVEFCRFQELKSLAYMNGVLSLDEANFIYSSVGESVDNFNSLPLATKVVFTQLFEEMLRRQING